MVVRCCERAPHSLTERSVDLRLERFHFYKLDAKLRRVETQLIFPSPSEQRLQPL
jgi:hypothetical protein